MELQAAINDRRSIRGFEPDPVSRETLRKVLTLASRAISGANIQPWEYIVVTGDTLDAIREGNIKALRSGVPADVAEYPVDPVYRTRQVGVAKQLFAAMDIKREDKERRTWWTERGFRLFDAPTAIFLTLDKALDETGYRFDLGCVAQNLCIAAMDFGLGTCVAVQPVIFQSHIRRLLNIPDHKQLICAVAIGYPDWDFPANHVVSPREDVDAVTAWHGFD